ncbi:MAG: hypothetical protein ACK5KO_00265 [Arachnia sp.]
MLAGILITVSVVLGIAVSIPWLASQRVETEDLVHDDPTARFSDSMRILRRDVHDYADANEAVDISTPYTRRAELMELRLLAASAARRRAITAGTIMVALAVVTVLSIIGTLPLWAVAVPGALLLSYLVIARLSVRAMQHRFDARAEKATAGYGEEATTAIRLDAQEEESLEISVDLSAPQDGMLWDPIPVTAPTYVSKPLVPRTVRTIDLSAPAAGAPGAPPTADQPGNVRPASAEAARESRRPRAVGQ